MTLNILHECKLHLLFYMSETGIHYFTPVLSDIYYFTAVYRKWHLVQCSCEALDIKYKNFVKL